MVEVAERFGTTVTRREHLRGLLRLRADIRALGLGAGDGFQWLDGSFLDLMPTEPGDIDVISFFFRPPGMTDDELDQIMGITPIFDGPTSKVRYNCDSYAVELRVDSPEDTVVLVQLTHYWFGLFSHSRNHVWRGIVQVPLETSDDAQALQKLDELDAP